MHLTCTSNVKMEGGTNYKPLQKEMQAEHFST